MHDLAVRLHRMGGVRGLLGLRQLNQFGFHLLRSQVVITDQLLIVVDLFLHADD